MPPVPGSPDVPLSQEIAGQMLIAAEFSDAFLDERTGELCRVHEFDERSEYRPLIEAGAMQLVPTVTSQELYLWMEEFAGGVPEAALRRELFQALAGIGAVWKFMNVMYQRPQLSRDWEDFKNRRVLALAQEWLRSRQTRTRKRRIGP